MWEWCLAGMGPRKLGLEFCPLMKLDMEVRTVLTWDQCSEYKRRMPIVEYAV